MENPVGFLAALGVNLALAAVEIKPTAEMLRKRRWDEVLFLDLPSLAEREAIWKIQIAHCGRKPKEFDTAKLARATDGLNGSELEALFVEALYHAFDNLGDSLTAPFEQLKNVGRQFVGLMQGIFRFSGWMPSRLARGTDFRVARSVGVWKGSPCRRRLAGWVAAVGAASLLGNSTSAQTWQLLGFQPNPSAPGLNAVAASADGSTIITAGTGVISISTNGGASWIDANPPATNGWASVVCSADGSKVFANGLSFIAISTNGGATWRQSGPPGVVWSDTVGSIACSADGNTVLAASGFAVTNGGSVFVSTNTGLSWNRTASPTQFWSGVACTADGSRMVAAAPATTAAGVLSGGVYTSTDSGASWTGAGMPTNNWFSVASSGDGVTLAAASDTSHFGAGSIFISTNSGLSWNFASFLARESWTEVVLTAGGSTVAAVAGLQSGGPGTIMVSTHSGLSGRQYDTSPAPTLDAPTAIAMSANGNYVVAATSSGAIYSLELGPPASPPQILGVPGIQTVQLVAGRPQEADLTVAAVGAPPLSYQWLFNGVNLPGATNANYSISSTDLTNAGDYQALVFNSFGSVTTGVSELVALAPLPSAPVVTGSESPATVPPGGSAAFAVTVAGDGPIVYQWLLNGVTLPGQTNSSLTLTNVQSAGDCQVAISNSLGGLVLDFPFTLQLAPEVTVAQTNQAVFQGGTAVFSAAVTGAEPFSYQWTLNFTDLPGATNETLVIPNVQAANFGVYGVEVTNAYGAATNSVHFTAFSPPPILVPPQLPTQTGGLLGLSWSSLAGQKYNLQTTTDLTFTNWASLGAQFIATSNVSSILLAPATNAQRFYRIVLLQ